MSQTTTASYIMHNGTSPFLTIANEENTQKKIFFFPSVVCCSSFFRNFATDLIEDYSTNYMFNLLSENI
jgi:hypothetical protein